MVESRNQRLRNLRNLGRVLNAWHFVYAIIFITFFPHLTKGTTIHEQVVNISQHGTLGILLVPIYLKMMRLLFEWYVKTGRNLGSLTIVPMVLVGALIGVSISYIILRIFKHDGDWGSTLVFSHEDVIIALGYNFILATFGGLYILIIVYYSEGQNVIFRDGKPTPFWKVLLILFAILFFLALMSLAGYI